MKKKKSWKNRFINFFLVLLFLVGLALAFNGQIKDFIVKYMTNHQSVAKIDKKEIQKNQKSKASFDFGKVKSLDFQTIVEARLHQDQLATIGGIAIPQVKLNLPIIKGVGEYALAVGAGTMKEKQVMGKGNYALASHHMINQSLLFSPLVNIKIGAKIYLTDLTYIYTYKVDRKEYVQPTAVEVIDDVPKKVMVTLVTCDDDGSRRLIVQGKFVKKTPVKKASKKMKKAFDMKANK